MYAKTFVQIVCNFPFGCRKFAKLVLCITVLYKTHIALAKGLLHFSQCIHISTLTTCLAGLAALFAFARFASCSLCACLHRQLLLLLLSRLAACHKNKLKFKVMICTHTSTHTRKHTHTLILFVSSQLSTLNMYAATFYGASSSSATC